MHITIITDQDPRIESCAGVNNYVNNMLSYLKKKNKVDVIARERVKGSVKEGVSIVKARNNYCFLFKLMFHSKKGLGDVIYAQRIDFLLPFIFSGKKLVAHYHGNPLREIKHKKGFVSGMIFSLIQLIVLKKVSSVIVVDENTKKELGRDNVVVIPIGVDNTLFKPMDKIKVRKELGFSVKDKIALYIGRFSKEKRVKELSLLFSGLDIKLIMVGEGNEEVVKSSNVTVVSAQKQAELVKYINAADCVVLYSLYEGMPSVVLESLSCGVPVVSTDVGDVSKVVGLKTGMISSDGNFIKSVKEVMGRSLKNNCLKVAREYSWDKIGKKVSSVLI